MSKAPEFSRLVYNCGVGGNLFVRRSFHVRRYLRNQCGNVIEKLIRRKDCVWLDEQQLVESVEPARGKNRPFCRDTLRHHVGVVLGANYGH
jgi:hypothetical protein